MIYNRKFQRQISYEQGSACTRYPLTSSWYEESHLASGVFHLYKYNKFEERNYDPVN